MEIIILYDQLRRVGDLNHVTYIIFNNMKKAEKNTDGAFQENDISMLQIRNNCWSCNAFAFNVVLLSILSLLE